MRRLLAVLLATAFAAGVASADETETLKSVVEEGLIHRPYLAAGWVRVRVEGATVTLLGKVPDELIRTLVLRGVRNVRGVKAVKDRLDV
ncbi:MAG: BON domain-containing protein, partial [Planctomycetota bacterium]